MSILLVLVIGFFYIFYFDTRRAYKANWNIDIPNPQKIYSPVKFIGGGDIKALDIMYYKEKDFNNIKTMNIFKNINDDGSKVCLDTINDHFIKYLNEQELEAFYNNFDAEKLLNENNYYTLLEKSSEHRDYTFDLLILDVENNVAYSIVCNYCYDDQK